MSTSLEAVLATCFGPEWLKARGLPEASLSLHNERLVLRAKTKGHALFGSLELVTPCEPGALVEEVNRVAQALIAKALELPDVPQSQRVVEVEPGIFKLPTSVAL